LRERREDVPLLARHFMEVLSAEHGRRPRAFAPDVLGALSRLPWPGNVRELRNIVERMVIMTPGDTIELRHLPASLLEGLPAGAPAAAAEAPPEPRGLAEAREDFERQYILRKYRECGGNMSRTAEALGVERSNLYRKMKSYGLLPARRDPSDEA
jgi:two-component system nitrogen regulation response regulator NtrX